MANEITNTEADPAIVEVWRREALMARISKAVLEPRVLNASEDVRQKGDIINIRTRPTPSVNDVGSNGSVTNQALTLSNQQLTVDQWREVTVDIVDKADTQSSVDLADEFLPDFARVIARDQDDKLFAKHSDITTNTVGDSTTGSLFDDAVILPAMNKLDDLEVPEEDRTWYVPPVGIKQLLGNDKFVQVYATGHDKGPQVVGAKKTLGELYGIPLMKATRVVTSSAVRKALLLHKEALAIATQKNFRIEQLARVRKSTPISGDILYGTKTTRENHGVVINLDADG